MKRREFLSMSAVLAASGILAGCAASNAGSTSTAASTAGSTAASEEPSNGGETIKIICPYGVGGTADIVTRKYAQVANQLQKKYNFIVENMTGGDGFAAATFFADEDPANKDLLTFGYGVCYRHDLGKEYGTEEVDFDRDKMYPIGTIDDRTWIVYTTPDQTLASILEKAKNGGIKMSGGNPLSDCHLSWGSLLAMEGGKVQVVPYDGGANQKKGLTDGEVDVFVGTTQAAKDEVEAGTLIPILAMNDRAFEGFVTPSGPITVPTCAGDSKAPELNPANDYESCILPAGGVLATHKGHDQAYIDELIEITKDVWNEPEFNEWIASILLNRFEKYGDEAEAFINEACEKSINAYKNLSGQA